MFRRYRLFVFHYQPFWFWSGWEGVNQIYRERGGKIQLLLVSDCLQFAVPPDQLSLDGSFSSGEDARFQHFSSIAELLPQGAQVSS